MLDIQLSANVWHLMCRAQRLSHACRLASVFSAYTCTAITFMTTRFGIIGTGNDSFAYNSCCVSSRQSSHFSVPMTPKRVTGCAEWKGHVNVGMAELPRLTNVLNSKLLECNEYMDMLLVNCVPQLYTLCVPLEC